MKRILGAAIAAALIAVAAQVPAAGQTVPTDCLVMGGGQITTASGDRANFTGAAETGDSGPGIEAYTVRGPGNQLRFLSLTVDGVTCNHDSHRAEIVGTGQVITAEGVQEVEYRIEVFAPNNRTGSADTYRITLSNGYDSGEQPVLRGNIEVIAL